MTPRCSTDHQPLLHCHYRCAAAEHGQLPSECYHLGFMDQSESVVWSERPPTDVYALSGVAVVLTLAPPQPVSP